MGGCAFEVTEDDIITVAGRYDVDIDETSAAEILDELDLSAVECAALYGNCMDEQIGHAHHEIADQMGWLD